MRGGFDLAKLDFERFQSNDVKMKRLPSLLYCILLCGATDTNMSVANNIGVKYIKRNQLQYKSPKIVKIMLAERTF
jgi:hypothetical protein